MPIKVGSRFGKWRIISHVGTGGNGSVWKAKDQHDRFGAIKFLHRHKVLNAPRYQRFKDEVKAMQGCADIPGVLPLLDFSIPEPEPPSVTPTAWLVTAYATPLSKKLEGGATLETIVRLCASLAETLSVMHERGYSHRDIKPENIFWHEGRWCLGDFGIADFPDKGAVTKDGEKLGPLHYIAPEMLNDALNADGHLADVYSIGKLLWKLATGQRYPLPGAQSATEPALTVSAYIDNPLAHTLDRLLEATTQVNPRSRPPMKEFARALLQWLTPPPKPSGPSDLTPYTMHVLRLTQPYRQDVQRRTVIQGRADSERARVFDAFSPTLSKIRNALQQIGIEEVVINAPSGGNGAFYHATTGNHSVGRGNDRTWLFQFSVSGVLRDHLRRVTLMAGVNLGVKNVEDDRDPLHDIYAPVIAAAGYVLDIAVCDGHAWHECSHLIWGETDTLFFGQPSEVTVTSRLNAGLQSNLRHALEMLLQAFEAAGRSEENIGRDS
jgi:serine/threonine protein kinase